MYNKTISANIDSAVLVIINLLNNYLLQDLLPPEKKEQLYILSPIINKLVRLVRLCIGLSLSDILDPATHSFMGTHPYEKMLPSHVKHELRQPLFNNGPGPYDFGGSLE